MTYYYDVSKLLFYDVTNSSTITLLIPLRLHKQSPLLRWHYFLYNYITKPSTVKLCFLRWLIPLCMASITRQLWLHYTLLPTPSIHTHTHIYIYIYIYHNVTYSLLWYEYFFFMTSLTPLLWHYQLLYDDVTNPSSMTSLTLLLSRP